MRRILAVAAAVLAIGCGDDGPPGEPLPACDTQHCQSFHPYGCIEWSGESFAGPGTTPCVETGAREGPCHPSDRRWGCFLRVTGGGCFVEFPYDDDGEGLPRETISAFCNQEWPGSTLVYR